jgi:hypothetical protein
MADTMKSAAAAIPAIPPHLILDDMITLPALLRLGRLETVVFFRPRLA